LAVEFQEAFTMLARTPSKVARAVSYECWTCPQCSFALTIIHSRQGTRVQYDIEAWERCCSHPNRDTPLACPCVGEHVWAWLSPPEKPAERPAPVPATSPAG
jgi:hypothetical protein